jgi:hypothetical protein
MSSTATYEQKVDQLVKQLVAANSTRVTLYAGDGGVTGYYWELVPHHEGAAKLYIYAVSEKGINLSVENFYWFKIEATGGTWDAALADLTAYIQAVLDGRVAGWFGTDDHGKTQYILEFGFGDDDPVQFTSNVRFPGLFKDREGVVYVNYSSY